MNDQTQRIFAFMIVFLCWIFLKKWFYIGPWLIAASIAVIIFAISLVISLLAIFFPNSYGTNIQPLFNKLGINDIRPQKKEEIPTLSSYNNEISDQTSKLLSIFICFILILFLYKIFKLLQEIIS